MIKFRKDYVNEDHSQHDDVQLDLMFHNDAKKQKINCGNELFKKLLEFVVSVLKMFDQDHRD